MSKKLLITVHGLNSHGEWQDAVVGTLSEHFICEAIRYSNYRPLGFFRNCFSLWIFPMLTLAAVVFFSWSHLAGYLGVGLGISIPILLAIRNRQNSVSAFLSKYEAVVEAHQDPRPHAVAHSFGTYLMCTGLNKYPDAVSFDRMLLFGSVVDRNFPWDEIAANQGVRKVRNEMGYRDWVVRLAGLAVWIRGMGSSGVHGFLQEGGIVDQRSYGEFRHSDAPALRKRIREVWLPFFWKIPTEEYRVLLTTCANCLRRTTPSNPTGDVDGFPKFDGRLWSWAKVRGRQTPFKPFIETTIRKFLERRGALSLADTALFEMGYPVARLLFWQNCSKHSDHPLSVAVAASEAAANLIAERFAC